MSKLESFLTADSLAALTTVKVAPPPPTRALVELTVPTAEPVLGEPCPTCGTTLEAQLVPWPPRAKPKKGPWEAWWCDSCAKYFVYQEIKYGGEKGGRPPLPQVQRPDKGNGHVLPLREGGVPGAVSEGGQKRAV